MRFFSQIFSNKNFLAKCIQKSTAEHYIRKLNKAYLSQNYINIIERHRNYQLHVDKVASTKPSIETTEIPMAPRVKNYIEKSESYRHKQKKIEEQHIKEINLNYRARQIYTANKGRRKQFLRLNSISRDWIGELSCNPRKRYNYKQTQKLEPLYARNQNINNISSSTKYIPLDIKMLYPDDLSYNYQSFEVLEPEDGMTVTDDEYGNSSNAPLLQQKAKPKVVLPNTSRVNRKTSAKSMIPSDDKKSLCFHRKTIVTSTQTELNNQEYEYEFQSESTDSYNQSSNEVYDFKIFNTTNPGRIIRDVYKDTKENDCEPNNISNEKDAEREFNIETIEFRPKEKSVKESDKEKNSNNLNEEESLSESNKEKNLSESDEEKKSSKPNEEKSSSDSNEEKNSDKSNEEKNSDKSNEEKSSSESNEEKSDKRDDTTSSSDESESKSNGLSKNDFSSVYQSDFANSIKSDFESDYDDAWSSANRAKYDDGTFQNKALFLISKSLLYL